MEIGTDRELEAALRLQQLAKHTKLLSRARGARLIGKIPFAGLAAGLAPVIGVSLARNQPGLLGWFVGGLVLLISAGLLQLNDRVNALVELLEGSSIIGSDLKA